MIVYTSQLPKENTKVQHNATKYYWDFIQDAVDDGDIDNIDNHNPNTPSYEDRVIGPVYDYKEWIDLYKEYNPKTLYRVVTRNKEDNQYRLFNAKAKIKYILLLVREDFAYGKWDCEDQVGYIFPEGREI
jgi:hypothetical protein